MISIKKAGIEDLALITNIARISFIESHGNSASAEDINSYISSGLTEIVIEAELKDAENIFHIIYFDGKAAGYSKIIFNKPYDLIQNKSICKLERLYLLKEFYDHKLGLYLFNFLVDLSKKVNQQGIWLYVWTGNERAVKFYKRAGFEIIANADFKISTNHANPNYIMYLRY